MNRLKFVIIVLLLVCACGFSQEKINVSVYQDARLLLLGDDKGNSALTPNVLFRLEMQGKQMKGYYFVMFPEFEYAEIDGVYRRYSVNIGWTFNDLFFSDFEVGATLGYGFINRWSGAFFSSGGSLSVSYGKRLKAGVLLQVTERKDLDFAYGNNAYRFSGFIGVKYDLF